MKVPDMDKALELGHSLERVGAKLIMGHLPDPAEAVKVLADAIVAFTDDIEELKPYLSEASRARQDALVELAARAQLGARPK